jgi:branched-chain amino acid transport system permease protein
MAEPRRRIAARGRWRWPETAFWLGLAACYLVFPGHLQLLAQVMIAGLFALSLDLLLGFCGIASMGHAAFFGIGAYAAARLALAGWSEPLTGLVFAGAVAGLCGFACSFLIGRLRSIALLMVTMAIGLLLHEAANRLTWLTGGDDGLSGYDVAPVLGLFRFDLYGRTAFLYCLGVGFLVFLALRRFVHSPFGLGLEALRENERRVPALGIAVQRQVAVVFTLSAVVAGIAGGLLAQVTQSVALEVLSFERSAGVLIMLVLGGAGHLYGGLIGAAVFIVARDVLAGLDPVYWYFWLGLILAAVVLIGRGGLLGLARRLLGRFR